MKTTTKLLLLGMTLVLNTACDFKVEGDDNSNNSRQSQSISSEEFSEKVNKLNHREDECPSFAGIYLEVPANDEIEFDPTYKEIKNLGPNNIVLIEGNEEFQIDGRIHSSISYDEDLGESVKFEYSISCENNKLRLLGRTNSYHVDSTLRVLNNKDLSESVNAIYEGKAEKYNVIYKFQN